MTRCAASPAGRKAYAYLPRMQHLAGITRRQLGMPAGRQTFATLMMALGVPRAPAVMATGHQAESRFNHCLGANETELLGTCRKTARGWQLGA